MAINNPYVPGDPFSYDLKWLVRKIKEHQIILDGLDERIQNAIIAALENLDQLGPKYFESAADLISSDLKDKSIAYIEGFYAPGDMGANLYYVTTDYNDIIGVDFYLTLDGPNRWALPIIVTPYVTPEMFGAHGDGIEDDSIALQNAAKYSHVIMSKEYKVTEQIALIDEQIIEGGVIYADMPEIPYVGQITTPGLFNGENISNVTLRDMQIIGTGPRNNATLLNKSDIAFKSCFNVNVKNVKIEETPSTYAIKFESSENCIAEECRIVDYTYGGICCMNSCSHVTIQDNVIKNAKNVSVGYNYPISLSLFDHTFAVGEQEGEDLKAIGNYIENDIPYWEAIDAHGGKKLIIKNNVIKNTYTGIVLVSGGSNNFIVEDAIIEGNDIELGTDLTYRGSALNACIGMEGYNISATGNICKNGGVLSDGQTITRAIYAGYVYDLVFSDNTIINPNGCVFQFSQMRGAVIKNNIISGAKWVTPGGRQATIFDIHDGLVFENVYITKNVIINTVAATLWYVYGRSSMENGDYIKIWDNECDKGFTSNNAINLVNSPNSTIALMTMGHVGDIVMNIAPASGQPIGWICTTEWVNKAGGVWTSLGNL